MMSCKKKYELPCGCEKVALIDLLGDYSCSKCGEVYWYSFCWDEVVQDSCTWHCEKCNRCTYGVTLACEGCGSRKHRFIKKSQNDLFFGTNLIHINYGIDQKLEYLDYP